MKQTSNTEFAILIFIGMLLVFLMGCTKPQQPTPNVIHYEHREHPLHGDVFDIYPIQGVTYTWKDSTLSFLCNGRYILTAAEIGDTLTATWWNGTQIEILQ